MSSVCPSRSTFYPTLCLRMPTFMEIINRLLHPLTSSWATGGMSGRRVGLRCLYSQLPPCWVIPCCPQKVRVPVLSVQLLLYSGNCSLPFPIIPSDENRQSADPSLLFSPRLAYIFVNSPFIKSSSITMLQCAVFSQNPDSRVITNRNGFRKLTSKWDSELGCSHNVWCPDNLLGRSRGSSGGATLDGTWLS